VEFFVLHFNTVRTVPKSNRKTTKYHNVRTVPTTMKNNKIPPCQDISKIQ
jgi:hypothetical protein